LCTQWRVRDVVAHVFSYDVLSTGALIRRFMAGRLNGDRVNAIGVAAYAGSSTDELLALAKEHLQPRRLPAGFGGRIALTDGLIHHQDIRRGLGIVRDVPTDRLRVALQFAPTATPIKASKRIRGLRLASTDLDWTTGSGPAVEGPAEALLMAIAGRPAALPELSGPGVQTLAKRMGDLTRSAHLCSRTLVLTGSRHAVSPSSVRHDCTTTARSSSSRSRT
jgi:uncharacterized protein (TIGR03083 family)